MTVPAPGGLVQVLWDEKRTLVALSGEITAANATEIQEAAGIARSRKQPLDIDARHVTRIDAPGFAGLAKLALHRSSAVRLLYPSPAICFIVSLTGLDDHVEIVSTPDLIGEN